MEDIFGILAFILFATLGLWQASAGRNKKKAELKRHPEQLSSQPVQECISPVAKPVDVLLDGNRKKKCREYSFIPEEEGKRTIADSAKGGSALADVPSDKASVCMHSAEEARRAFIYSEIFNRKY